MSYIIMTSTEWKDKLIRLARQKSDYINRFPYNLLYWSGSRWSADCSNLEKALFNGRDIDNPTPGSYGWPLTATGDCTEYGLITQCSERSSDFGKLKVGEPRLLYMEGHIGAYLGEEWDEPGQGIVNCVECTPAWEDGIQFSYCDRYGNRSWCKGASTRGRWTEHGKATKWVDYSTPVIQPTPDTSEEHYGITDLAVMMIRGKFGFGYENRKAALTKIGYTDEEVRAAQDKVNEIVKNATEAKAMAEQMSIVCKAAYDVIAGAYGDGQSRKDKLTEEFGAEVANLIQGKVEEFL